MFEIVRYTADKADEWNHFVAGSKNGTFLFDRHYMDYHADRFHDHSLMFYDERGLYALLPANDAEDGVLYSHKGLTYGGLVTDSRATANGVCTLLLELKAHLLSLGFHKVIYKPVPWIYHRLPSEEDLYALFLQGARLIGRDISSTIIPLANLKWSHGRKYAADKARKCGIVVEQSEDYAAFWRILTDNLERKHSVKPVHSLDEIQLLHSRFPENIRLYVARCGDEIIGGTVLYLCGQVVHAQYISATEKGKRLHAIDALYEQILKYDYADAPFFDFGKSTVANGYELNESLAFQKEGFGGRGLCYDTYEWTLC